MKYYYIFLILPLLVLSCTKEPIIDTDKNAVYIKQAKDVFNKYNAKCNYEITLEEECDNILEFPLNIVTLNNLESDERCDVELYINYDTIDVLKKNPIYSEIKSAEVLSKDFFELSSYKTSIKPGDNQSEELFIRIKAGKIWNYIDEENKPLNPFVIPLSIKSSGDIEVDKMLHALLFIITPKSDSMSSDDEHPEEIPGMKLIWHDEFNGNKLDESKWTWENGFVRNEELQWYQRDNISCKDGNLIIEGRVERVLNPNYEPGSSDWKKKRQYAEYTSACIKTPGKFQFKYGRLLVRAKIPTTSGSWPAIWTLGNKWEWPLNGEIDILELYLKNGVPGILANAAWGSNKRWSPVWDSSFKKLSDFVNKDSDWVNKYHIWRMDWDENCIKLYLDDVLLNQIETSKTKNGSGNGSNPLEGAYQNPFSNNISDFGHYILLNLAIGSNGGTPDKNYFPLKYYVDYVRVYQKE